jgi:hypothetical protein
VLHEKIIKLLNLAGSDNDHEALSAIRKANSIVRANGLSWDALLTPSVQSVDRPRVDNQDIEQMINSVYQWAWDGFDFTFIDSLSSMYEKHGWLTPKQYIGLQRVFKAVSEHEKRRGS